MSVRLHLCLVQRPGKVRDSWLALSSVHLYYTQNIKAVVPHTASHCACVCYDRHENMDYKTIVLRDNCTR